MISFMFLVVTQDYDCYVNQAHVIRGNDVLMKCDIPSFVTDFVTLLNWQDDQENIFSPSSVDNNGTFFEICTQFYITQFCPKIHFFTRASVHPFLALKFNL